MKVKSIEVEALVAMFIIAMGKQIGEGFTYFPKLPNCFSEHIKFGGCCPTDATLTSLEVDENFIVRANFNGVYKGMEAPFDFTLKELEIHKPMLLASIITHVCDMIENIEI